MLESDEPRFLSEPASSLSHIPVLRDIRSS